MQRHCHLSSHCLLGSETSNTLNIIPLSVIHRHSAHTYTQTHANAQTHARSLTPAAYLSSVCTLQLSRCSRNRWHCVSSFVVLINRQPQLRLRLYCHCSLHYDVWLVNMQRGPLCFPDWLKRAVGCTVVHWSFLVIYMRVCVCMHIRTIIIATALQCIMLMFTFHMLRSYVRRLATQHL